MARSWLCLRIASENAIRPQGDDWSGVYQVNVSTECCRELFELVMVHGDDLVSVLRE
jgi:hypothetical protein